MVRTLLLLALPIAVIIGGRVTWPSATKHQDHRPAPNATPQTPLPLPPLTTRCRLAANEMRRQLGDDWTLTSKPPFVLATNSLSLSVEDCYEQIVKPFHRRWQAAFGKPAVEEVYRLVISRDRPTHIQATRVLVARWQPPSRLGFFDPTTRTSLISMHGGDYRPRLRHELSHALMSIDFADAPSWLAEGIATLHESGLPTGRVARRALRKVRQLRLDGRLESIQQLVSRPTFSRRREAQMYAYSGCVCEFLQQRGVLDRCYRACRDKTSAAKRLPAIIGAGSWRQLQAAFDKWLDQQADEDMADVGEPGRKTIEACQPL